MSIRVSVFAFVSLCLISNGGRAQQTARAGIELKLAASCGDLRLTAQAENAIRVRCSGPNAPSQPELIFTAPAENAQASIGSDARSSWIQTRQIKAVVDKQTGGIRFVDARGKLLTEEIPGSRRLTPNHDTGDSLKTAEVRYVLQPDEHLYGSGQFQDGYLDIAKLPRTLVQLNTQIALPFFLSSRGYGLLWHNYGLTDLNPPTNQLSLTETGSGAGQSVDVTTSSGTQRQVRRAKEFAGDFTVPSDGEYAIVFDTGQKMTDRYHVQIDGKKIFDFENRWLPGATSTLIPLTAGAHHVTAETSAQDHPVLKWGATEDETDLRSPDAPDVDYTVFAGDADQVIGTYRKLSGEAPMLPEWAFGFIQCRERYHSSQEILDNLQQFRKDDLPLDLIVQDWQYWGKYGWNAMHWDETYYPDPAALVKQVHDDHAHLMVSVWSSLDPKSEVGKQFAAQNLYIPGTMWLDFFNPATRDLYWKNFSSRMLSLGIDAWWLDATEPENDDLHNRAIHTGPGDEYRLVYPLYVTGTVYQGSRRDAPDKRVMILTRSAFLGEQRNSISTWSGDIGSDWDTLRRQVTAGLDFAASGLPYWTTDTGGFFRPGKAQYTDPAYHERFLRWLEFSTFTPLMRVHGYQTNTEPWNFGPEMVEQQRKLEDFRYQLLPYIYSQAAAVTNSGGTIMRPLVMDFPQDDKALAQKYEYMFGPAFLVAPVLEGGVTSATVYAPQNKGGWFDWWSGAAIAGGTEATVAAPVEQIPLLVRAGSIVPLGPVQQYVGQEKNPAIELRIYPGTDGKSTLYDDDGTSYGYEHGQSAHIGLRWNDKARTLTLAARQGQYPGMAQTRQFRVRLLKDRQWTDKMVTYNGKELTVRF